MSTQIAVRLPDEWLAAVDAAVGRGRFKNRTAAVLEAIGELMRREHDAEIAAAYSAAYSKQPSDTWVGEAGAVLAAETVETEQQ